MILAPILLFSSFNPIMVKNPVKSASLQIALELNNNGNSYSILQTQAYRILPLKNTDVDPLQDLFESESIFFEPSNMQKLYFSPYSDFEWMISPPSLIKFIDDYRY